MDRTFFFFLIFAALVTLKRRQISLSFFSQKNIWLIVFFTYCGISIFWSDFPFVAFKRWIKAIGEIAIVMVVLTEVDPIESTITLYRRCAYVLLPLSIVYIRYFPELGRGYSPGGQPDYHGVCCQKNALALLCMVSFMFFFWSLLQALKRRNILYKRSEISICAIMLLISVYLMNVARSSTTLACLFVGVSVLFIFSFSFVRNNPRAVPFCMLCIVVVILGLQFFIDFKSTAFSSLGRDETFTGRTEIWAQVLSKVENPLFGTGYNSFWLGQRLKSLWGETNWAFDLNTSHNGYIETYINIGLVGLVLLCILLLGAYFNIIRHMNYNFEFGRLSMAFYITTLMGNITEAAFRSLTLTWFTFLITSGIYFSKIIYSSPGSQS
ncbi:MAG: O-antigen ligase family protein [Chitinispirillaceae bacterium]|nr:O-antigen ligase family protein [Chitinispirillaceae bacterium]